MLLNLNINGANREFEVPAGISLLDALRGYAALTGTKYGCGEGECGACTVHVDGRAVKSCLVTARSVAGKAIVTIEGLAAGDRLHPVQQAFLDHSAFQCAFCTPGMIMGAAALLASKTDPSVAEIRAALDGHLCRCGAYPRIVEAVRSAAKKEVRRGRV